jgi:hypothetical protein
MEKKVFNNILIIRYFKYEIDVISYYEKENGKQKGVIGINDIMDILPNSHENGFNIITRSKSRVYELKAFSKDDQQIWIKLIKEILALKKKKKAFKNVV